MRTDDRAVSVLRRSGVVAPGIVALIGLAILLALGMWQIERLQWKIELIARVESRAHAEPAPLPAPEAWPALDPEAYEYRAVRLAGRFRHADEVHVYTALSSPRGAHGGPGWWVLTPLELDGGGTVIVNRGFVPEARKDPETRDEGQAGGTVEIAGLMRAPQPQGPFVPDDRPGENIWFTRAPDRIAAAVGLEEPVAPFLVDARAGAAGGLPQGGETRMTFRNDHLGYALTWFGLALALAAVYGVWARGRLAAARRRE